MNASISPPWRIFAIDMNADGELTVSDVSLWLQQVFFLPGDSLVWAISVHAPQFAVFLELGPADYGGVASGFISAVAWFFGAVFIGATYARFKRAQLAAIVRVRAVFKELLRRARVAQRRLDG